MIFIISSISIELYWQVEIPIAFSDMDEIIKIIAKFPYRPLYLKKEPVEKSGKYSTLFVNEKEFGKSLNPAELIKKIF